MSTATTPQQITGPQGLAPAAPIGFGTAAADSEGVTFADVMRIVKQRKLMILITSIILYILVVGATFATLRFAPLYTSDAIFEVLPPKTGAFVTTDVSGVDTRTMEQMIETEARKLKSLELLRDVAAKPQIKATSYYAWYESKAMQTAYGLQGDLKVSAIPETRLIRVSLATRNRTESQTIVKTIVDLYDLRSAGEVREARKQQVENLHKTLDQLTNELSDKRIELEQTRESGAIPAMQSQRMTSRDYLSKLKADLSDLDARGAALQSQLDSLQGYDPALLPLTADQQLIVEADPQLRLWRSQAETLEIDIQAAMLRLGPNHRDVKQMRKRREGYLEKETARREELISQVRARQYESLKQDLAQTQNVQARVHDQFITAEAEERDLDKNIQTFNELDHDRERLEKRISEVELKLTEAEHAERDQSRVLLQIVQRPQLAVKPSRPNFIAYLGGGFLLALAGGFGLAFLREFTDKALRTPIDVARFGHVSVLGSIPMLDDEEAEEVEAIEDAVRKAPHSLVAEAFRKVRTNLQFSGPEENQRILLFTSPSPGDGKSTVAINLAYTMAHSDQKVLLIDCNFRRPAARSRFVDTRPDGLSNILIGKGSLEEFVSHSELPNLDVLTCGPMPPTPAELLGSAQMRELLEHAARQYDRILLDGPPVLLISDAIVLAGLVNGVVLVARADDNTKGELKRAREQLDGINTRLIGAVFNGVKARPGGYFRSTYREFYDYISDETVPPELPGPPQPKDNDA